MSKQGLDDFLLTHSVEDLLKLPKITLGGKGWALERKAHKAREAKKKQKAEVEAEPEEKQEEIPQELLAKAWLTRDLIATVSNVFKRFVVIQDQRMYTLIAIWTVATYVYESFDYFPILRVTSPTKRSGKTRLLEILRQLASRSAGILINPTEAILFRVTNRGATLILDEVEQLRQKDKELHGSIMAVLNSGFQKGATVPRTMKDKDGVYTETNYNTYGPKVVSGISSVSDTIADRSLVVQMIRRIRAHEPVERFRLRKLTSEFGDLVFQLRIWAAAKSSDIQGVYDGIDKEPDELKDCDDRFLDIVEPLLAIAAWADAEYTNGVGRICDDLILLLKDLGGDRDESDGAAITVTVETIAALLGYNEELDIPSADILEKLREKPATEWITSGRALATFVSKLGLRKSGRHGKLRSYSVTRAWVEDMKARYNNSSSDILDPEVSQVSQPELTQGLTQENKVSQ
jgi:Protein of unknown function (DUF3631)